MTTTEKPLQRVDRQLGQLFLRILAVLAFLAGAASIGFGAVVLVNGHVAGILPVLLGFLFLWLGMRAWRDRATLDELLSRDYQRASTGCSVQSNTRK